MDDVFMDEIDRDWADNGPGESVYIRCAKAEQSVREVTAERDHLHAKLEELAETYASSATKAAERLAEVTAERDRLLGKLEEATERAATAETQIQDVIDKYGDPEDAQTLDQVVQWFVNSSNEGWNSAGDELAKRLEAEKRADAAEAALAEERWRLDWIAQTNSMTSEEVAELINGYIYKGKYRGNIRAAIDAARNGRGEL